MADIRLEAVVNGRKIARDAKPSQRLLDLELDAAELQRPDLLAHLRRQVEACAAIGDAERATVIAVIQELVLNALEHGLLRLDPSLQEEAADGLGRYHQARQIALAALHAERIHVLIRELHADRAHELVIAVEDTGARVQSNPPLASATQAEASQRHRRRGLALIEALSSGVSYRNADSSIEVTLTLPHERPPLSRAERSSLSS